MKKDQVRLQEQLKELQLEMKNSIKNTTIRYDSELEKVKKSMEAKLSKELKCLQDKVNEQIRLIKEEHGPEFLMSNYAVTEIEEEENKVEESKHELDKQLVCENLCYEGNLVEENVNVENKIDKTRFQEEISSEEVATHKEIHIAEINSPDRKNSVNNCFGILKTRLWKYIFRFGSNEGFEEISPTIHSFGVYAIANRHWSVALLLILTSLIIVSLQIVILDKLGIEATRPPCTIHTDCLTGQYCQPFSGFYDSTPRCADCSYIDEIYSNENVNCTLIKEGVDPWDYGDIDEEYIVYNKTSDPNSIDHICLSQIYCTETDVLGKGECDDYTLNKNRITTDFKMALIFLALLGIAPALTIEIESALREELVMKQIIKQHASSMSFIAKISVQLMHIPFRIRRCVIPLFAAGATAGILFDDTFLAQNLVLNIVAILFLIEIDDVCVTFFFPPQDIREVTQFLEEIDAPNVSGTLSFVLWLWPRIVSVIASFYTVYYLLLSAWPICDLKSVDVLIVMLLLFTIASSYNN